MAEIDLFGLLRGRSRRSHRRARRDRAARVFGVTLGVVTSVDDDKGLGRVQVKLPWLSNQVESAWASVATPWAGQRRGSYFLPEVDDEVLVAFRHGDTSLSLRPRLPLEREGPAPRAGPEDQAARAAKQGAATCSSSTTRRARSP